jgi:hypothetical protein
VKHNRIAFVAAFSLLAACGDSATNVIDGAITGSLSFNYTGGGGGTYSATGAITSAALASSPFTTTWAAGFKDASDNSTNIAANIPRSSTTSDFVGITVKAQTTGTFNIDVNCVQTGTSTCNDVVFFTAQTGGGQTFSNSCSLTSGSITVSTLSSTSAVGSFSGAGICFTGTGAPSTWTVTNGTFSVPLLANVPASVP